MCYLAKNSKGEMVDMVTGELVGQQEVEIEEVKRKSMAVNNNSVPFIVRQVFGSSMVEHTKVVLGGNRIYLDNGWNAYTIVVEEFDNIYNLYLHREDDTTYHCRKGNLIMKGVNEGE